MNAVFTKSSVLNLNKYNPEKAPVDLFTNTIHMVIDELNRTLSQNGAAVRIRFVNEINEYTPCNFDREKGYFEITRYPDLPAHALSGLVPVDFYPTPEQIAKWREEKKL